MDHLSGQVAFITARTGMAPEPRSSRIKPATSRGTGGPRWPSRDRGRSTRCPATLAGRTPSPAPRAPMRRAGSSPGDGHRVAGLRRDHDGRVTSHARADWSLRTGPALCPRGTRRSARDASARVGGEIGAADGTVTQLRARDRAVAKPPLPNGFRGSVATASTYRPAR